MFYIGIAIILTWLVGFSSFGYYGDIIPRNISVGMVIGGLFSMGWGLLKGKSL